MGMLVINRVRGTHVMTRLKFSPNDFPTFPAVELCPGRRLEPLLCERALPVRRPRAVCVGEGKVETMGFPGFFWENGCDCPGAYGTWKWTASRDLWVWQQWSLESEWKRVAFHDRWLLVVGFTRNSNCCLVKIKLQLGKNSGLVKDT